MRKLNKPSSKLFARRNVLKSGLGVGVSLAVTGIAAPLSVRARAEAPVKIGMIEPVTGGYGKLAAAEIAGARLAVEEINAAGGILGRPLDILIADSNNDVATGVAKAKQLIDRDEADFILGDLNSAVALAVMRVTAEKRKLHIVTGGHTNEITGVDCSWNVFRICKTATMEANAIADTLIEKFGKRWYFLTPNYVYGATLQTAFQQKLQDRGGIWAGDVIALGTVDYSRFLLNAAAFRPDVLINLMGGDDQANSLTQIVRFSMTQDMAVGGALFELESILAVPPAARVGWWTMEWWWNQPQVPEVKAFDSAIRARTGTAASARNWFGYAGVHVVAGIANQEKSLDPIVLARALQSYTLPRSIALDAERVVFNDRNHQLMSSVLVGEVHPPRADPFDVFTPHATVKGSDAAGSATASGCRLAFPS
jgi:branched-chain amino acid transport system substrate-binding protein